MKFEESTDIIAKILYDSGVRHVIASSGSRSLRMVRSVASHPQLNVRMIVDERVAAFSAIGISDCTAQPTALICTSGTAMLNYAPAIAEAYYRGIPMIIITADRPIDIIDINDGQTIHQFHALDNIVKKSIDIDATRPCCKNDFDKIIDTISFALSPRKGPIHINLHLEEGNDAMDYQCIDYEIELSRLHKPNLIPCPSSFPKSEFALKKTLIFLGQMPFDSEMISLVEHVAVLPNIVVVADVVSNCNTPNVITDIESLTDHIKAHPDIFNPELVITLGKTSPVSRRFKEWLRSIGGYVHWRVNDKPEPENTYFHLERTIIADEKTFLKHIVDNADRTDVDTFNRSWMALNRRADAIKTNLLAEAPWSDIAAINMIIKQIPGNYTIQCSNGMSIRYLSLTGANRHRLYCNRGVNGIDGSTSTAIGYSSVSDTPTLLISGDMSALYDISALYSGQLSPNFKMIVIANEGGEIFRLTQATRSYEKREEMLCNIPDIKWKDVASSVNMDYFEAQSKEELESILNSFFVKNDRSTLLIIKTPMGNSNIYRNIIKEINKRL